MVYAVEFSHRSGRDLVNMAKKRTNVIPIIEDARHPAKYRMLVGMVDVIFSDVAQPDQVWSLLSCITVGFYFNSLVVVGYLCYLMCNFSSASKNHILIVILIFTVHGILICDN